MANLDFEPNHPLLEIVLVSFEVKNKQTKITLKGYWKFWTTVSPSRESVVSEVFESLCGIWEDDEIFKFTCFK